MTTSTVNVTKQLTNDGWAIQATITSTVLPSEIFVYNNTGTTQLGDFYGIIAVLDLPRVQIWQSSIIPVYGNKFVRYGTGNILVPGTEDPDIVISRLIVSIQRFSTTFQTAAQSTTQVITVT